MTTIRIVLDTPLISKDETRQLAQMARQVLPTFLPLWLKPQVKVEVSTVIGAPGTWNFYLTEKNAMNGAYGHHGLENGVPAAWITPSMCGLAAGQPPLTHDIALWGSIRPAQPRVALNGKVLFPGAPGEEARGFCAVVMEEIMEALVDPNVNYWVKSPDDQAGNTHWFVEVNDNANAGNYVIDIVTKLGLFKKPVHRRVVLPDATLPSFYVVAGRAPFTFVQWMLATKSTVMSSGIPAKITKPFDQVTDCYAYIKDGDGANMAFFSRKEDSD